MQQASTLRITIDGGNTFIKTALFCGNTIKEFSTFSDIRSLSNFINLHSPEESIISNVGRYTELATEIASLVKGKVTLLTYKTPVPVTNKYQTPQTLGMDRLAAAVGASFLFPDANCLIIDTGSCITYDIVDQHHQYLGGTISPGINIRFQALHAFTAGLPLISLSDIDLSQLEVTATSTKSAIASGVMFGLIYEIEGVIAKYRALYPFLKVVLLGGDAQYFEKDLKQPIFAIPELVHIGLNRILEFNNA